jgi:hypothetical protein
MANEGADTFLRAEEQAHRLVEELSKLKRETESYNAARTSLQEAGSGIATFTDSVAGAAKGLQDLVVTLRSIGTPELLKAQETTATELASLRKAQETTTMELASLRRAVPRIAILLFVGLAALTVAFFLGRGG